MKENSQGQYYQSSQSIPQIQENIPEIHFECNEGKALQLVRINNNRTFEIIPETVDFLKREIEGGIAICSIVGKYRTGKSFLLNRLLDLNEHDGFNVSPSINACTKGLWIWSKPIFIQKDNLSIIFMDTEGLDSVDRNLDTDARLFVLTVLLSSYFIYNSIGAIDEVSISTLSLITYLIKTVALEEDKKLVSEYQLSQFAPKLLWIIRDFVLEIKDQQGKYITAPQYLESALVDMNTTIKGGSKDSQKSYQIRQTLINFFKNRDCLTMVRPVNDEADLRNIQHLKDYQIRPDFLNSLHAIRNKIYKNCTQKVINGIGLNANMLVVYLQQFVESFNSGKLPVIQTAWKSLMETECRNHYEKSIQYYEEDIKNVLNNEGLPEYSGSIKKTELFKALGYLRDISLNYYNKCCHIRERDSEVFDRYKKKLKDFIDASEKRIINTNLIISRSKNSDLIYKKFSDFMKSIPAEKLTEEGIIDELGNNILDVYVNQNFGGETTADFCQHLQSLSKNLFEWFSTSVKQDAMVKKNSIIRNQTNEAEKLKIENENYKNQIAKVNEIQSEIVKIERKIEFLESGINSDRISKSKAEQAKLNDKMAMISELEKKNSSELAAIGMEIDKFSKKKKFC